MTDKFAQYAHAVKWTSNGPVRVTTHAPRLSWWQRLVIWWNEVI